MSLNNIMSIERLRRIKSGEIIPRAALATSAKHLITNNISKGADKIQSGAACDLANYSAGKVMDAVSITTDEIADALTSEQRFTQFMERATRGVGRLPGDGRRLDTPLVVMKKL